MFVADPPQEEPEPLMGDPVTTMGRWYSGFSSQDSEWMFAYMRTSGTDQEGGYSHRGHRVHREGDRRGGVGGNGEAT